MRQKQQQVRQVKPGEKVTIAGAGPAGLSAAILLARAGVRVEVHEAKKEVGFRFQQDLQGLENWTSREDILDWMHEQGLATDFNKLAGWEGTVFDYREQAYHVSSQRPFFYMVERGPGEGSLDTALLQQAIELGVEVIFNSRLSQIDGPGILAIGPRAADAIAVGYHFKTDMADGFWVICDNQLAPEGYAYLLVMNGKGTVKSCMFTDFKHEQRYVERTVAAFEKLAGLQMIEPVPHGGAGNFVLPSVAVHGSRPLIGEQAGFQDTLWGFGMRYAMASGIFAARSLLGEVEYDELWKKAFHDQMQAGLVNRALYARMGNRGYRWVLKKLAQSPDPLQALQRHYQLNGWRRLLIPWARRHFQTKRRDRSCNHVDCGCVWCRCGETEA